ncbi:MAG: DegV family protein [Gammaproteobacteria bacterium]
MAIEYLDGRRYRQVVVAGADWVRARRDHLNRINVYPVPDGDTGTNMALSLASMAAAVRTTRERDLSTVARLAAEGCTLGAKGNSGVILAQWFLGMSVAFNELTRATAAQVGASLAHATDAVYDAVEKPVEGTILSVMKAVSDEAVNVGGNRHDLGTLMDAIMEAGKAALARTPEQLAVLREANVVDAGAQGYIDFLEGVRGALRGEQAPALTEADLAVALEYAHGDPSEAEITERFCTEVVIRGAGLAEARLKRAFRGQGSALLIVTTGEVAKLHVHTNHPDEVIKIATGFGDIAERKVDDMLAQMREREAPARAPLIPLAEQPDTIAVLCDSTADLSEAVRREHGIEMAPLQVLFGDRVFRDQIDLSTHEFYELLETDSHHPTTSQPPPRAFLEAYERVRGDRVSLVLTISAVLSGTRKAAVQAADLAPHPHIEIVDSESAGLGFGMLVLNAARLAGRGASLDVLLEWIAHWKRDTGMLFSLATLEYLRRGGRIGAARAALGSLLSLRPILTFEDGQVVPLARASGDKDAYDKLVAETESRLPEGTRVRLGFTHIGECEQLASLEQHLRQRCEVIEVLRSESTGAIGAHAGPGAWGVFYQRVRHDDPLLSPP